MMLLRKMLVPVLVALVVVVTAAGCETDEDSPFDKEGVEIDWPTLDPSRYHWNGVTSPYFEFWAWHIIADDETNFTITLGISNPGSDDPDARGAIVSIASNRLSAPIAGRYSASKFDGSAQTLDVTLGNRRGTERVLRGKMDVDVNIAFDLRLAVDTDWDESMGLLTNIPGLPLNWHLGGLRARADGSIKVGADTFEFVGAAAQEDHYWGREFPGATTRVMANNFDEDDTSFAMLSGDFLVGIFELPAILMAFEYQGTLYEFRTPDLDVLVTKIEQGDSLQYNVVKGDLRLVIDIFDLDDEPQREPVYDEDGPSLGGFVWRDAQVQIEILRRDNAVSPWQTQDVVTSTLATLTIAEDDVLY